MRFFGLSGIGRVMMFLLVWAAMLQQYSAQAAEPIKLKAMTFNIRYDNPQDGPNRWEPRREWVAEMIRRFDGDFVGIQEALPNQLADLNRLLPEYRSIALSRDADPSRGEATPIFYRHERWTLDPDQHGTFWLSDTPDKPGSITWDNACPRIVTWGRFVEQPSGRAVYVYNTHFDHRSEAARQKAAMMLADRIAHQSQTGPIVVMGDLNSGESDVAVSVLTGQSQQSPIRLFDTFRTLHPDAKDVGTFHAFHGGVGGKKIDYIFVKPEAKVLSAEIIHNHHDDLYPSDHYPVTAEVIFSE